MANVAHHPHTEPLDMPSGVYWVAGIALAFLALLLAYFAMTNTGQVATMSPLLTDPALPFVPFIPML